MSPPRSSRDRPNRPEEPLRVAVIGAGSSGLVTLRALAKRGIAAVGFERGSVVGGLWVRGSDSGHARVYDSLRINTSVAAMELSEFPMPRDCGDYPTHEVIARYFSDYAQRFALDRLVRFRTEVISIQEGEDGYEVASRSLDDGAMRRETFSAVVVATGHHHEPSLPNLPGSFEGPTLHASEYRNPKVPVDFEGRRVLVVGFGNSAVDIASELAERGGARSVHLSTRRGAWVLPRYLLGRPIDGKATIPLWIPGFLRRRIVTSLFTLLHGRMSKFGLPEPDHRIGEAHPTISSELPGLVRAGKISVVGDVAALEPGGVRLADGRFLDVDAIVFATGYRTVFPFLDPDHVRVEDNTVPLFERIFPPEHRRLFFVALAQTTGAIFPIAERQADLIARHLSGEYALPDREEMLEAIEAERRAIARRYVRSPRHTMQIDPEVYTKRIAKELARGQRRATHHRGLSFPSRP